MWTVRVPQTQLLCYSFHRWCLPKDLRHSIWQAQAVAGRKKKECLVADCISSISDLENHSTDLCGSSTFAEGQSDIGSRFSYCCHLGTGFCDGDFTVRLSQGFKYQIWHGWLPHIRIHGQSSTLEADEMDETYASFRFLQREWVPAH